MPVPRPDRPLALPAPLQRYWLLAPVIRGSPPLRPNAAESVFVGGRPCGRMLNLAWLFYLDKPF